MQILNPFQLQTPMRIDNHLLDPDRPADPREDRFRRRIESILVKTPTMAYAEVSHAYREIEAEVIQNAGYDEWEVLETRRRIAEAMVQSAHMLEQPFETCRDNWNALVELGFSSIQTLCNMAWFYADSCLFHAHYDAGLEVLELVLAEIHRRLDEPNITQEAEEYYDQEITSLEKLYAGLVAHRSSEAEGIAWDENREAAVEAYDEPSSRQHLQIELMCRLSKVIFRVRRSSSARSFSENVDAYRRAEADFIALLQPSESFYQVEVRRQILYGILEESLKHREPFEVGRGVWNEIAQCGFAKFTQKCAVTRLYAGYCLVNRQRHAGLAVVEPLLTELRAHIAEGTNTEMPSRRYPREIGKLEKLRDELRALPTSAAPPA